MKKLILSALALIGASSMMPNDADAQFRVVKDGAAILVMDDEVPDYIEFEGGTQNVGHISLERLLELTSVTVNKTPDGKNGNVLTCKTTAPVSVKWYFANELYYSNNLVAKMEPGEYSVYLTAYCADGTELSAQFDITCDEITEPLNKYYLYGEDSDIEPPFSVSAWNAADMRFSDYEGNHLPFISEYVYWHHKTLVFDITDTKPSIDEEGKETAAKMRVMNGWWSSIYDDNVEVKDGLWKLKITEEIAIDCARGSGGKDLTLLLTSGSCTINSVYYEDKSVTDANKKEGIIGEPVDLGLSVNWSSVNIGASRPEEAGGYYAWGETKTKDTYDWSTYKQLDRFYTDKNGIKKYQVKDGHVEGIWYENAKYRNYSGMTSLVREDDAAAYKWAGNWAIPTVDDWKELIINCSITWTNDYMGDESGIKGYIVKSRENDNSIFLPEYDRSKSIYTGVNCLYWTSELNEDESSSADAFFFNTNNSFSNNAVKRYIGVNIRPICPGGGVTNDYEAVDLGLPSGKLWSACDLGASSPEISGELFAWGETETKSEYTLESYLVDVNYIGDNKSVLEPVNDIATKSWGDGWRMPTQEEWLEFFSNTTGTWTANYFGTGVSGYIFKSTKPGFENAYIFIPASGYRDGDGLIQYGSSGNYWSSSLGEDYSYNGFGIKFDPGIKQMNVDRCLGLSIRPVKGK